MFKDSYWKNYQPIDYSWHIVILIVFVLLFIFGTISNFGVIIYYLK